MDGVDVLRVGLVGAGPWARRVHGPVLAAHPAVTVAGVWTRRREPGERLAAEVGGRAHDRFDDLLADVDAVAFAVPPQVQGELAARAAAAGRHLICEKPLAESLDAAGRVVAAVSAAGVVSTIVMTLRFDPAVRRWLAGMPEGIGGPGWFGSARWLSGAVLAGPYSTSNWRAEHGALLDIGPHLIDLMDAALGRVAGVRWAHCDDPDLWRIGLHHAGGASSSVTMSLRLPVVPSEVEFAVFGGGGRHRLAARAADAPSCYARLLDEFVAAVLGSGPAPPLDAAHGLYLQDVIEQVRTAAG
jgi:predicted dehydrogenase